MRRTGFQRLFLTGAAALALAACGDGADVAERSFSEAPAVGAASMDRDRAANFSEPRPPAEPSPQPGAEAGVMLAYSYSMGIEGPKICQVLGSSVNSWGEDQVSGYLNLRAEPKWLADFRATIATDADAAGGRLTSNTVNTEDLTAYLVDLEARLAAKLTLRDRIRNLLETRDGSLSDILAAERALADVQGEIDSMTAQRAAARARVDMSALSISYQSDPVTSTGVFKPLVESFKGFFRTSIASLADAVDFVARTWPFFIVGLIVLFVLRGWWRGRRAKA